MTTQNEKIGLPVGDGGVAVDPNDATFAAHMEAIYLIRADKDTTRSPAIDLSSLQTSLEFFQRQAAKLGKTLGGL